MAGFELEVFIFPHYNLLIKIVFPSFHEQTIFFPQVAEQTIYFPKFAEQSFFSQKTIAKESNGRSLRLLLLPLIMWV